MPFDDPMTTDLATADLTRRVHSGLHNILVVKLGAFGNIILSLAAFAAIRQHHSGARISVLTSETYAGWLRTFPYFDDVMVDPRPQWWDLPGFRRLGRMLTAGQFARVYDLQTSARSSRYFHLFPARDRPEWSGIAFGCALPDRDPKRNMLHDRSAGGNTPMPA
jgi:ADP-heptose:LPS heptosyltransferase